MNRNVNYAENSVKVYRYFEFYEAINVNISRLSLSPKSHHHDQQHHDLH